MNRWSMTLAASLAVASLPAAAQSQVDIFGIADMGLRYLQNGSEHQYQAVSGGHSTSRLGFRGTEDLGGGLKAQFWLESQVNYDNGTSATKFWHRRSTVSLMGSFGEIRLGRDFSPAYRVNQFTDAFGDTGIGASSGLYSTTSINGQSYTTHTRADNVIAYWSPEPKAGVYGSFAVAPGEGALGNRLVGGFVGLKMGPAHARIGYSETQVADGKVKHGGIGLVYELSGSQILTSFNRLEQGSARENHVTIGAIAPVAGGGVRAMYVLSEGSGGRFEVDGRKNRADKIALGYWYDLSKRTLVYVNTAWLRNKGGASFVVAAGPTLGNGRISRGADIGIRHTF